MVSASSACLSYCPDSLNGLWAGHVSQINPSSLSCFWSECFITTTEMKLRPTVMSKVSGWGGGGGGGRGSTMVEHCPNHHPPLALQKVKTNQPKRAKSQFHRHFAINVFNQHCFFHSLNRCIDIVYINHIRYSLICFHLHIFMYYHMVFIIVAPTPKYKINFLKIWCIVKHTQHLLLSGQSNGLKHIHIIVQPPPSQPRTFWWS